VKGEGANARTPLSPPTLDEIRAARARLPQVALHTPLLPLPVEDSPAEVWLKLENLQPIGSFKLRGAGNAMALADPDLLERGVYTASAGNMAQGVAWNARRLGIPCTVVVPDHAPRTKIEAIHRLGAETVAVPFQRWWQVLVERSYPGLEGLFIHPVSDPAVLAGNGTVGLEILEALPEVDAVVAPWGGGGLSCGIASALRARAPDVPVYAAEVATAAPLAASLAAGAPTEVEYVPSFVDGIGSGALLEEMWPLGRELLAGSLVSDPAEVARTVRLLVERCRIVAEGAGAAPVAAALAGRAGSGTVVCVVSGGNLEPATLAAILDGRLS